jgi:hypothetical protein
MRDNSTIEIGNTINKVLSDWDPIGVGKPVSDNEYAGYVTDIIQLSNDINSISHYLQNMLLSIGLDFDSQDEVQKMEIEHIASEILKVKIGTD